MNITIKNMNSTNHEVILGADSLSMKMVYFFYPGPHYVEKLNLTGRVEGVLKETVRVAIVKYLAIYASIVWQKII